jgi:hypothetical protein
MSGDRFTNALEINDLFEQESPTGRFYVRLKEMSIPVEREWWIDEEGTALWNAARSTAQLPAICTVASVIVNSSKNRSKNGYTQARNAAWPLSAGWPRGIQTTSSVSRSR